MFALYLDIQKQLDIEDLDEVEVRGRWKSFVGKWNRGELAEGWYSPETLQKSIKAEREDDQYSLSAQHADTRRPNTAQSPNHKPDSQSGSRSDEDDEDFGPALPSTLATTSNTKVSQLKSQNQGPTIPRPSDLLDQRAEQIETNQLNHLESQSQLKTQRKADRQLQKERLEDLIPLAEPGSRERQLEKKRERASANREFANARGDQGGADLELRDTDLLGGDDGDDIRRMKKEHERKKNERELRREEMLRARKAEREERLKGMREKEEKTMDMFREIARQRFGSGAPNSST